VAREYLKKEKLEAWAREIELMVTEHHKLRASQVPGSSLVELFRKADSIAVSLGFFSFGLAKAYIKQVSATFPTAGVYQTGARLVASLQAEEIPGSPANLSTNRLFI
jgi:hypothetical protein